MTTPHPHADLLHAIADGKQMQRTKGGEWYDCTASVALGLLISVASHTVRVRPEDEQASQESKDAINILVRFARGLTSHRYTGNCPSDESPSSRDPECMVCWAIDAARSAQGESNG